MADHIENPHAPVAPHEGRKEPLVNPPRQFVAPGVPHAPVEQQRPIVPQKKLDENRISGAARVKTQIEGSPSVLARTYGGKIEDVYGFAVSELARLVSIYIYFGGSRVACLASRSRRACSPSWEVKVLCPYV
ncbi:hypothetical protein Syun_023848 [Stephania yunnanensis]|uniref:Uncharacterized protein n=1 Tax=Stephania yunnanensis TaxID=152371 RepID=A0AAP0FJV2_9MAGN